MENHTEGLPPSSRWALLRYKRLGPLDDRRRALTAGPALPLTDAQLVEALRGLGAEPEASDLETTCFLFVAVRTGLAEAGADSRAVPSLEQMGGLKLVDSLFHALEFDLLLHPDAFRGLRPLQVTVARCLHEEPAALFDSTHPARALFELLLRIARCYDHSAGQRGEILIKEIARATSALMACDRPDAKTFLAAQAAFVDTLHLHQQAVARIEQRLIEKEQGESRLQEVRGFVRKTIEHAAEGKRVPEFVMYFLREVWEKYLYVYYLRQGIEHPAWHQGVLDMRNLIWSVTTRNGPKLQQRLPTDLADSLERIRQGAEAIHHQFALVAFFEQLSAFHLRTIKEEKHPRSLFATPTEEAAPVAPKPAASEAVNHSPTVPPEVLQARVGQWYRLFQRGREVRGKLIERNLNYRYLLFVNLSGILIARLDFEAFVWQLRIGSVESLSPDPVWESLLHTALDGVERYVARVEGEIATLEQARRDEIAAEVQEREAERRQELHRRIEAEEQRLAAERMEARRRIEEEARRERETARVQALADVERLQPGGMVELTGERGEILVCALGLKLKNSRKLVFVDRNGRRMAELLPEQLAERLQEGSAAIIGYQSQGDRNLDTLLWDLRSKTQPRSVENI